ncbi:hypothetical protein ACFC1R_08845 [Kitasatospora sp. NPDC056138]|uniref:hypothetical protein n=1 Tax=Kitasatospora sp. NPDC056138 TaxID=3345724 RepID=UPI0035D77C6B
MLEVLLAVLEVVADDALLQQLTDAMMRMALPARFSRGGVTIAGRAGCGSTRPLPCRPTVVPVPGRRP